MKVKVVSTKLIKPCTPTPKTLSKYEISFTDEDVPQMNVGVILFYNQPSVPRRRSHDQYHLEESLSEILPKFYPLAGRYMKNDHFVDCSDQGAEFSEAEALDVELKDILLGSELLNDLFQSKFYQVGESPWDPLLSIQITGFKCGGFAISVSVSHRIFDASSLATFIAAWSSTAATSNNNNNNNNVIVISPSFDSPSLFPRKEKNQQNDSAPPMDNYRVYVKRLSFNKEAIARMRSELIVTNSSTRISRVRVVCAAIAKTLIGVDRAKNGGGKSSRPCLISQPVNIRGRTLPPLPNHSCGNLSMLSLAQCITTTSKENEIIGMQELVDVLGEGLEKTISHCSEILSPGADARAILVDPLRELMETLLGGEVNIVLCSDLSKFGFNDVDFGFGDKPVGVAIGATPTPNTVVLMDNKQGDGLEAWVHLDLSDVPYFDQQIQSLLAESVVTSSSLLYDVLFQWKNFT